MSTAAVPAEPLPAAWVALLGAYDHHADAMLGLTAGTRRNHRIYLTAFLQWWQPSPTAESAPGSLGRALAALTPARVAAFLSAEAARGLSPRTRKAELAALRALLDFVALSGWVTWAAAHARQASPAGWHLNRGAPAWAAPGNPARAVPSPRVAPVPVGLYDSAQMAAVLAHTATLTDRRGRQRHAIVACLRWTGMRSVELRRLPLAALDLPGGRARVVGKGGRQRVVLLPPPLVAVLTAFLGQVRPQLPDSPLLLVNPHPLVTTADRGFGQEALSRECELAALGAGLPDPTGSGAAGRHHAHRWRHSYATELVRRGVDIHVVQRLLGHRELASTLHYTHLALDDLAEVVARVWPAEPL